MRVVVLPADESACGLYRMRYPAGAVTLARPEWTVEVYRPSEIKLGTGADGRLWSIYGIADPEHIDVLVMQRCSTDAQVQLVQWMQKHGTAVVMDSDDAMWAIDPDNAAYAAWNGGKEAMSHWRFLDRASNIADLVTCTTPALAQRYGKHGRVEVLPNCLPAEAMGLPSIRSDYDAPLTIGWSGFTSTHPHDLEVVGDAVARFVKAQPGREVVIVGDADGARDAWGLRGTPVHPIGPVPVGASYLTALTAIDVALVPLRDTPFNRAKSALKVLEFRTMGARVIASPTPANKTLSEGLSGVRLAQTPDEWLLALEAASSEAVERDSGSWTYEERGESWAKAWERAYARRTRLDA